jgi:hypothetical protein
MCTFESASTQLGEIPQRKWTKPFDEVEAARLNAEAARMPVVDTAARPTRKGGLFGRWRKGSGE